MTGRRTRGSSACRPPCRRRHLAQSWSPHRSASRREWRRIFHDEDDIPPGSSVFARDHRRRGTRETNLRTSGFEQRRHAGPIPQVTAQPIGLLELQEVDHENGCIVSNPANPGTSSGRMTEFMRLTDRPQTLSCSIRTAWLEFIVPSTCKSVQCSAGQLTYCQGVTTL